MQWVHGSNSSACVHYTSNDHGWHTHTHTHAHTHTHMHTYTHVCICTCTQSHKNSAIKDVYSTGPLRLKTSHLNARNIRNIQHQSQQCRKINLHKRQRKPITIIKFCTTPPPKKKQTKNYEGSKPWCHTILLLLQIFISFLFLAEHFVESVSQ